MIYYQEVRCSRFRGKHRELKDSLIRSGSISISCANTYNFALMRTPWQQKTVKKMVDKRNLNQHFPIKYRPDQRKWTGHTDNLWSKTVQQG